MLKHFNNLTARLLQGVLLVVFTLLVLDVLWGVLSRYLLGGQAAWSEELARLLMVWLALLGAALVAREGKHLGMDTLTSALSPGAARIAAGAGQVVILLFAGVIMGWGGGQLVADRLASGQLMPSLGVSKAWFYLALPFSGFLICLYSIETLLRIIRGDGPPASASESGQPVGTSKPPESHA